MATFNSLSTAGEYDAVRRSQRHTAEQWARLHALAPVLYVARADRKAGGVLVAGSQLSAFFTGASRQAEAELALRSARQKWPDAGIFHADSTQQAEALLAGKCNA